MRKYVVLEKLSGETPLAAIGKWKGANPEYKDVSASYAGRLDPMASGKLLVLLGEECKRQKEYTKLDKEYEIEVLLDVGSDTGDALGLVEYSSKKTPVDNFSRLDEILRREEGSHTRLYPVFSSKTVHGKPLFMYALEGTLGSINIPAHNESVYRIKNRGVTSLSTAELSRRVTEFLAKVPVSAESSKTLGADFRIKTVTESWKKLLSVAGDRDFLVLRMRITCGSGTYMRSLAPRIGEALGTRAITLSIHRVKIGKYWRKLHYLYAYS